MKVPYIDLHTHSIEYSSIEVLRLPSLRLTDVEPGGEARYSLGLHPWFIEDLSELSLFTLNERATSERVWAIGEAGLDKLCATPFDRQIHYFSEQIALSERLERPLIIHCVRAWAELLALRKGCRMPWVIHGFRGKPTLARQLISSGCFLSFGQYFNAEALHIAQESGHLFLETDDAPVSIQEVYARVSDTLSLPLDDLCVSIYHRFLALVSFDSLPFLEDKC